MKLIEVEPGRWRVRRDRLSAPRSELPCPMVISDTMDAVEQVDGKFYESKAAFRAVGRSLGLTEVGNEKPQPKIRSSADPAFRRQRQKQLKTAIEKARAGHYERHISDTAARGGPAAGSAGRSDDT